MSGNQSKAGGYAPAIASYYMNLKVNTFLSTQNPSLVSGRHTELRSSGPYRLQADTCQNRGSGARLAATRANAPMTVIHIRMLMHQSECFIYVIQVIHDRILIVLRFHDSFTPVSRHPSTVSRHPSTVSRHSDNLPRVYPQGFLKCQKIGLASSCLVHKSEAKT